MFRRIGTMLGACAFLMIASSQAPLSAKGPTSDTVQPDQTFWLTIKDTTLPDLFEMFIKRYPKSAHRAQAERTLKSLQGKNQPSAMDQAKQLMKKVRKPAKTVKSVAPATKTPATRAPALAAPALAVAPVLAATPALIPAKVSVPTSVPAAAKVPASVALPAAAPTASARAGLAESPADDGAEQPVEQVSMETIILLQHHLNRVGCSVGKLDGKWGTRSRSSAARFAQTVDQPYETDTPNTKLLIALKQYEDNICAPVKNAKPRFKKTQRARISPSNRKKIKSKKVKSRKNKVIVLRKASVPAKAKRKVKVVKKAKQAEKIKTVKRKPQTSGVSGDPFSGGGGGGGGWQ